MKDDEPKTTAHAHKPAKAAAKTEPETHTVTISSSAFNPSRVECKPGDSVTWSNNDDVKHSIQFTSVPDGTETPAASNGLLKGQSHTLQFKDAGTYEYACGSHSAMRGSVVVS